MACEIHKGGLVDEDYVRDWVKAVSAPARILVVDDEETILDVFKELGRFWNCKIDTTHDGESALDLIAENDYRIIFLDLRMPGMDGVECFERIKALKPNQHVAILSGFLDAIAISRIQEIGFAIFIAKPFPIRSGFFEQLFAAFLIMRRPFG